MSLEEITLALFAACNSFRLVAYVPQILKAASDKNGASSISYMTWFLFLLAHLSTVAYAVVNRSDWGVGGLLCRKRGLLRGHTGSRLLEASRSCPETVPAHQNAFGANGLRLQSWLHSTAAFGRFCCKSRGRDWRGGFMNVGAAPCCRPLQSERRL